MTILAADISRSTPPQRLAIKVRPRHLSTWSHSTGSTVIGSRLRYGLSQFLIRDHFAAPSVAQPEPLRRLPCRGNEHDQNFIH